MDEGRLRSRIPGAVCPGGCSVVSVECWSHCSQEPRSRVWSTFQQVAP